MLIEPNAKQVSINDIKHKQKKKFNVFTNVITDTYEKDVFNFFNYDSTNNLTKTNPSIRNYVNSPETPIPYKFKLSYTIGENSPKYQEFINEKALKMDAGHKLGNQFGGIGRTIDNIIPMNPTVNRGAYQKFEHQMMKDLESNIYLRDKNTKVVIKFEATYWVTTKDIMYRFSFILILFVSYCLLFPNGK